MQRFTNILYVNEATVDQSSSLARAVWLAEQHGADLTIVDVIPAQVVSAGIGLQDGGSGGSILHGLRAFVEAERRKRLEALIQPFAQRLPIRLEVLIGRTFLETIRVVLQRGVDLLVKAAENPSWTSRIFGSDDLHLLRKCPCPVWLMKPQEKRPYGSIMAAVDFDLAAPSPEEQELNRDILELAASFALADAASLHIVHAWEVLAQEALLARGHILPENLDLYLEEEHSRHHRELSRLEAQLRDGIGAEARGRLATDLHLPNASPHKSISEMAANLQVDLVVMGTVAATGIPGVIIGNTAEAILDQLRCSVLAVKPPDFTSPVTLA